ncbi:MAG: PEP-CTERM sorting domain-containing protein [Akkermansiaceae bacterium]
MKPTIKQSHTKNVLLTLAISAATIGSGMGITLIHESFDMPTGPLHNQSGGLGLGTWTGNGGGLVSGGSMVYGALPTAGNKYIGDPDTGSAGFTESWNNFGTTLSDAGLLNHGGELWFSLVLKPGSGSNDYGFVGLSSAQGNIGANFSSVPTGANMAGIWLQNGSDFEIAHAINGTPASRNRVQNNLSLNDPTFAVGKFTWGADAASNDLFEIYLPGTDLALPGSAADSSTMVIDQSTFDELGVWMRNANSEVDEIRFGGSYDDVIATVSAAVIPEPSSTALLGLGFLGLLTLRRR